MTSTGKQKEKDAARMKSFRANASAEQEKIWSKQAMEQRKRRQKKTENPGKKLLSISPSMSRGGTGRKF